VALIPDEDFFCESCGSRVQAEPEPEAPAECPCFAGLADLDEEGFCLQCGRRAVRPAEDHIEVELSADFAGVSDRGLHHHSNEDRFAIGIQEDWRLMVVCDGVSSSPDADKAAAQASQAALVAMQTELANGSVAVDAVKNSVKAASEAVSALGLRRSEAPSTTIVSAAVSAKQIAIAWIGDSRAYWIAVDQAHQLTADHSWLNMTLERGDVDRAEAKRARNAHALTRWLGLDSDPGEPDTVIREIDGEGLLLLCSDGLWNYADTENEMSDLMRESSQIGDTALEMARHLIDHAIAQGGRDNITVALMRRAPAPQPEESAEDSPEESSKESNEQ
jgi:serine/threonine protein phosphatase PrpC